MGDDPRTNSQIISVSTTEDLLNYKVVSDRSKAKMSSLTGFQPPKLAEKGGDQHSLIEQYSREIREMGQYINDQSPSYVIALSRSGPRILERFQREGLIDLEANIITEKALQTMDDEKINDSNLILFDDIIIAGTTIWTEVTKFTERYNSDLEVVTLATDIDTVGLFSGEAIETLPENQIAISCGPDGDRKVPYRSFAPIRKKERFKFSKMLIQCVAELNKPYDIDFAILHSSAKRGLRRWLESHSDIHNLTTIAQQESGLERYSLLVPNNVTDAFQRRVFAEPDYFPRISKLRIYYDHTRNEVSYVPLFLFSLDESSITEGHPSVFNPDNFDALNDLLGRIDKEYIDGTGKTASKTKYRLVWFIVSYLFGQFLNDLYAEEGVELIPESLPEQQLQYRDLVYLFGPSASQEILEFLNERQATLEEGLTAINIDSDHKIVNNSFDVETPPEEGDVPNEEQRHWRIYHEMEPALTGKLSDNHGIHGNAAIIFEQLYSDVELDAQERISKMNGDVDKITQEFPSLIDRLQTGFTVPQIAGILTEHTSFNADNTADIHQLSLSIDLLIDRGEQIPIFYRDDERGTWDRAYRHGESAFIVYEELRGVMYHVFKKIIDEDNRTMTNVGLEKIAVLIWKSMYDAGLVDELNNPTVDRIHVQNTFLPFGHTLDIHGGEGMTSRNDRSEDIVLQHSGYPFVDWAQKSAGIIEKVDSADSKAQEIYRLATFNDPNLTDFPAYFGQSDDLPDKPSIKDYELERLRVLASLLKWIRTEVRTSAEEEYLIGITSCSDLRSYLHALREELRAMFEPGDYHGYQIDNKLLEPIDEALDECEPRNSTFPDLGRMIGGADNLSLETPDDSLQHPSEQIETKMRAWEELESWLDDIETYFLERDGGPPGLYSNSPLPMFFEEIRSRHRSELWSQQVKDFVSFTEKFAELSARFNKLVWQFNKLSRGIIDDDEMTSALTRYNDLAEEWNTELNLLNHHDWIANLGGGAATLHELAHISEIERADLQPAEGANALVTLRQEFENLATNHDVLADIYDTEFEEAHFSEYLNQVASSVWSDSGEFIVTWDIQNGDDNRSLMVDLDAEFDPVKRNTLIAEDSAELIDVFQHLVNIVGTNSDEATLQLGIASVQDVNGRLDVNRDLNRIDPEDLAALGNELLGDAKRHHENVADALQEQGSPEARFHSLCITSDVRESWVGILPKEVSEHLRIRPSSTDVDKFWATEVYDLENEPEWITRGCCSFTPTEAFMTEKSDLSDFTE